MKKMSIYRLLTILITATIIYAACTKENTEVRLDPKLGTTQTANIKSDSAIVTGFVIAGNGFSEKGVCWDIAPAPTVDKSKAVTSSTDDKATYKVTLTGLKYATKYYVRAYAVNADGTIYGDELNFTTLSVAPFLSTTAVSAITGTTATSGGNITDNGGEAVTARGVCWSTNHNPTISDGHSSDGTGSGVFTSNMTGLRGVTIYYVRAYATNHIGTSYGTEVSFTTGIAAPTVTTRAISNITGATAQSGGIIPYDGGGSITSKGVCWSTTASPTIANSHTTDGIDTSRFGSTMTGLALSTTYHVRAYAANSVGISYGDDVTFQTFPTTLYMIGDGVGGWDWASVDLPMVSVNSHPNLFWKIVWMNATGEFKFAPQKAWVGDFGKTGDAAAGVYSKGGDNIPVPGTAGYYMVVVDLTANKIAIADPKVYLTGNTVGSWGNQDAANLFTVDNANSVLTITKTLAADNLRMFVWHPWFTDWWQAEFNIFSGAIGFRGTGGDQAGVPVTAGSHTINLNFKTGAGAIL